jgi:uncharacterized protein YndB with AHSA1/START domain
MPSQPPFNSKPSLTLKRRIEAPPEKIFRAWTEPEKITRWFGPGKVEVLHAEADARVGGRYRIVARSPNGEQHEVSGTYREVVPNEKLVFTWAWRSTPERESRVTVLLGAERRHLAYPPLRTILRRSRTATARARLERLDG